MKKNRVFMFAAAVAALLLAACDKEQQGYDSFILDIAGFSGADGSKAYWNDQGFWWENNTNPDGGDVVRINGDVHNIYRDGSQWKTHAGAATTPIDGNYYIAYAGDGDNTRGMGWDSGSKLYGPVTFDGSIVPLARSGSGNRMTLDPCCAVIKMAKDTYGEKISFDVVSGKICSAGYIDPANLCIVNGTALTVSISPCSNNMDDGYDYYIIPIEGNSVTCTISTDWGSETSEPKTLRKGYVYVIN